MRADREAGRPVVGEHPLPVGLLAGAPASARSGSSGSASWLSRPPAGTLCGRGDEAELPEELPPLGPKRVAGARRDERLERRPFDAVRAGRGRRGRRTAVRRARDRLGLLLADRPDVPEPDPDGAVLDRARRPAQVHVGRLHLHPASLPVTDEAGRRVEAHRLRVQERAQELGRIVVPQPRRLVGEQANAAECDFGKPKPEKPTSLS